MQKNVPKRELFIELCKEFPGISTRALARMAFARAPQMFRDARAALNAARNGRCGNRGRRKGKPYLPPSDYKDIIGDAFDIPTGKINFRTPWEPFVIQGPFRALVLADTHIPYHDQYALDAALNFGRNNNPNYIILNGDIADFFSISQWEKDPRQRDFAGELEVVRDFIFSLRVGFPKAKLLYKLGNHEERFERYMRIKAPELLGVPEFEYDTLLGLKKHEIVRDKRPIRAGDLNVIHGHEYRFAISNPVNPARGLFLKAKDHAICGHFHQSSYHPEKTLEGRNISCWSTGCLCDMHPEYRPINNWNHGFAFAQVEEDGKFEVQNKYIGDRGRIY